MPVWSSTRSRGVKRAASAIQLKTSERGTTTRDGGSPSGGAPQRAAGLEQGQHLDGLAEAHVVRQAAAEAEVAEEVEPAQPGALIAAELAAEPGRRRRPARCPGTAAAARRARSKASSKVDLGLARRARRRAGPPGPGGSAGDPPRRCPSRGHGRDFFSHSSGSSAEAAVAQRHEVLAAAQGREQGRASGTVSPSNSTPPCSSNQSTPEATLIRKSPGGR